MTAEVPWTSIATIVSILAAFAATTRWMLSRVDDRIERVENRSEKRDDKLEAEMVRQFSLIRGDISKLDSVVRGDISKFDAKLDRVSDQILDIIRGASSRDRRQRAQDDGSDSGPAEPPAERNP